MARGWIILLDLQEKGDDGEPVVIPHVLNTDEEILQIYTFIKGGPDDPIDPPDIPPHEYVTAYKMLVRDEVWGNVIGRLPAGTTVVAYEIKEGAKDGKLSEWARISDPAFTARWVCIWWGKDTFLYEK